MNIDYSTVDSLANYWLHGWELEGTMPAQVNLELSARQAVYMLLMSRPNVAVNVCAEWGSPAALYFDDFGRGSMLRELKSSSRFETRQGKRLVFVAQHNA